MCLCRLPKSRPHARPLPPVTLSGNFLQGICRHSIQTLHDCCLGPSRVYGKGNGWYWPIFKVTGVKCFPTFRDFHTFALHILHEFNSNIPLLFLWTIYNIQGKRHSWPWPIFKVIGVKLWPNLGFMHFSTSHFAWLPFKFYKIVALDYIHWGKWHSWPWPSF